MITKIRVLSQQLARPSFGSARDLVSWMGAMQAQDYTMQKWAVGIRLKSGTIGKVEKALNNGEILRTHVMRPTWHLVAAEDIRWMLKLSAKRIRSACDSWHKGQDMPLGLESKSFRLMEKIMEGNKSLTKQEIAEEFNKAGIVTDDPLIKRLLINAETEGLVCSGVEKKNKPTYALLEERVAPVKELHKEEALAKLALNYFRSHSPATFEDFLWWSGLNITEARQAIGFIEGELMKERFASSEFYVHSSCNKKAKRPGVFHLMPAYDEYLISYKDRSAAMDVNHYPKAFTNYGIFFPVVMHNGRIVGNWKKVMKKGKIDIDISFIDENFKTEPELIEVAKNKYLKFLGQ